MKCLAQEHFQHLLLEEEAEATPGQNEEIAPDPFSDTSQIPHSMSSYLCAILFLAKGL